MCKWFLDGSVSDSPIALCFLDVAGDCTQTRSCLPASNTLQLLFQRQQTQLSFQLMPAIPKQPQPSRATGQRVAGQQQLLDCCTGSHGWEPGAQSVPVLQQCYMLKSRGLF